MTDNLDGGRGSPLTDAAVWIVVVGGIAAIAGALAWGVSTLDVSVRRVPSSELVPAPAPREALPPPGPMTDRNPGWKIQPQPDFPLRARLLGVEEGTVVLNCAAPPSGRLVDCRTMSETPKGYGFASQAIDAAHRAEVHPRIVDGVARSARINFFVRYVPGDAPR